MKTTRVTQMCALAAAVVIGALAWWQATGPVNRPPRAREFSREHRAPTAAEETGVRPGFSAVPAAPSAAGRVTRAVPPPPRKAAAQSLPPQASGVQQPPTLPQPQTTATRAPEVPPTVRAAGNEALTPGELSAPETVSERNASMTIGKEEAAREPLLHPPVLLDTGPLDYPTAGYRIVIEREGLRPQARVNVSQGRVILKVLVRTDGTAASVEVFGSSGDPALDAAAIRAARNWNFLPATRDGVPIEAWAMIPVRFVVP